MLARFQFISLTLLLTAEAFCPAGNSLNYPTRLWETKASPFQDTLASLEQGGTLLRECDASQVNTLQAAVWEQLSDISQQDEAASVCLIFPQISLEALRMLYNDFMMMKIQPELMQHFPELERVDVSTMAGPALLMESRPRSGEEMEIEIRRKVYKFDETKCRTAMVSFVNRVVVGQKVCPYMISTEAASVGPVVYHYDDCADACAAVAAFWKSIGVLEDNPDLSSTVLSLPAIGPIQEVGAGHDRFAAVVQVISQSLCLFGGDETYSLVHFHPLYTRDWIHPRDKPAYGHLPPQGWLRTMMEVNGSTEVHSMTDDDLELSNFQRRSPHTAVNVLRVSQLEDSTNESTNIVDLQLPDGRIEKASGLRTYSRNAITLAQTGTDALEEAVGGDLAIQEGW